MGFLPAFNGSAGMNRQLTWRSGLRRYLATPAYAAHDKDARKQRLAADAAKRQAEEALTRLHARQTAPVAVPDHADRVRGVAEWQRWMHALAGCSYQMPGC